MEFRFVYFTPRYEETVAFLRDGIGLAVTDSWDRPGDHRGTVFGSASGLIEVLENNEMVMPSRSESVTSNGTTSGRPPAGFRQLFALLRRRSTPASLRSAAQLRGPSHTATGGPFAAVEVEDVDALHARVTANGVPTHYPLEDKPWGHRGFSVLDPNGVEIAFFSRSARAQ